MKDSNPKINCVENVVQWLSKLATGFAGIVLGLLVAMTFLDVILRYFFARPISGSSEITQYMMVVIGFMGLATCALEKQHLEVELLVCHFSKKVQWVIGIINYITVIGLSGVLAWFTLVETSTVRLFRLSSNLTQIPQYPFYYIIAFAFVMLGLAALGLLVQTIVEGVQE